jgi:hypothetical protein
MPSASETDALSVSGVFLSVTTLITPRLGDSKQ